MNNVAELENPRVSVVVVTYNHKDFIEQCLEGILMQKTNFAFEIILGEDESTDGTRDICKECAKSYPKKIKLYLRSRKDVIYINGKPTGRYNMIECLKASKGKYIALCEGDDYWTDPLKLQKQVDFLEENPNINLCFHGANMAKNNKLSLHAIPDPFHKQAFNYIELLKHYNFITTASIVFRKPSNLKLPKWFKTVPFGDLGLYKLIVENNQIQCINEVMSVYRIHKKGIYSGLSKLKAQQNYLNFYRIIYQVLNKNEKQVVDSKIKEVSYRISKLRFPKNRLLQKIYNQYLRLNM